MLTWGEFRNTNYFGKRVEGYISRYIYISIFLESKTNPAGVVAARGVYAFRSSAAAVNQVLLIFKEIIQLISHISSTVTLRECKV